MTKQLELKRISDERLMDIEEDVENAVFCGAETPIKAKAGAKAQLQADKQVLDNVKQAIFDEGNELCPHYRSGSHTPLLKRQCIYCWQALKKKWLK